MKLSPVPKRAFPVVYAADVARTAAFYEQLGFVEHFRLPDDGEPGYIGLARDGADLGVTTVDTPRTFIGVEPGGGGPRFELYVFVDDVDETFAALCEAGAPPLMAPGVMPWGERLAFVADPDGNPVGLAAPID